MGVKEEGAGVTVVVFRVTKEVLIMALFILLGIAKFGFSYPREGTRYTNERGRGAKEKGLRGVI